MTATAETAVELKQSADALELQAAWLHIREDFVGALERRNRYYAGRFGLLELLRSGGASKLTAEAEAEVDRLHLMLKAIDRIRRAARLSATAGEAQPEIPVS